MGNTCSRIEPSKNHWVVGTWIFQSGLTFESLIYQKQTWGLKIWQALEGLPFPNLFLLSSTWLPFASSWNGAWIGWLLRCVKRALEDGDSDNVESEIRRSPRKVGSVSPLYIIHPRNSPIFFHQPVVVLGETFRRFLLFSFLVEVEEGFCFGACRQTNDPNDPPERLPKSWKKHKNLFLQLPDHRLESEKTSMFFWEFQLFVLGQVLGFCTCCGGEKQLWVF